MTYRAIGGFFYLFFGSSVIIVINAAHYLLRKKANKRYSEKYIMIQRAMDKPCKPVKIYIINVGAECAGISSAVCGSFLRNSRYVSGKNG